MASSYVEIASAVVDALEGASLSLALQVARAYAPVFELPDFADGRIRATVIPAPVDVSARDLEGRTALEWGISIVVQRKSGRTVAEDDPLMNLVEEIVLLFAPWRRRADLRLVGITVNPAVDPDKLNTRGLFTAVVTLTIRAIR